MTKLSPLYTSFPKSMPGEIRNQLLEKRAKEIRELTRAELDEVLASGELTQGEYNGEVNTRQYYEGMNPAQLDFDATFTPHAVVEKKRRNGELQR